MSNTQRKASAFSRYMNEPARRAHVFTWHLAKGHGACPLPLLRLLPRYRTDEERAFRIVVAREVRERRKLGRVYLPAYVEDQARYVFTSALKYDNAEGAIHEIAVHKNGQVWLRQWTRINPGMLQLCWVTKNKLS